MHKMLNSKAGMPTNEKYKGSFSFSLYNVKTIMVAKNKADAILIGKYFIDNYKNDSFYG